MQGFDVVVPTINVWLMWLSFHPAGRSIYISSAAKLPLRSHQLPTFHVNNMSEVSVNLYENVQHNYISLRVVYLSFGFGRLFVNAAGIGSTKADLQRTDDSATGQISRI